MNSDQHRERLLEAGLAALAGLVLGGLVTLLLGRAVGEGRRRARHGQQPPAPGSVPPERHRNIGAVSTR